MKRTLLLTLFLFPALAFSVLAREAKNDKPRDNDREKNDKRKDDAEPAINWRERMVAGPAVLLRLKREPGKFLIYEGSLSRTQAGANSYTETGEFYLTVLCADKREETIGSGVKTLDLLALRRTYTDRSREEKFENGKTVKRAMENTENLIDIGPNYEVVGALRCHAYDDQNSAAFRTETQVLMKDDRQFRGRILSEDSDKIVFLTDSDKLDLKRSEVKSTALVPQPHICLDETPHYLFPPFSSQKKAPGDTWRFKVPIIIPLKQGNPPQVLPTQFYATVTARLCEVRSVANNGQIAIVEYRVNGVFDTAADEFSNRFPAAFHDDNHIVHKISGEGVLHLDLEKSRIIEKTENFTFSLFGKSKVLQGAGKAPKEVENQLDITSHYQIHLLPPGSKMKNGKTIPSYD